MLDSWTQEDWGVKLMASAELQGRFRILLSVWSVLLSIGRGSYSEPLTLVLSSMCSFTYHAIHQNPLPTNDNPISLSVY